MMSASRETTFSGMRRTRRSIGGLPPPPKAADKENATDDMSSSLAANRKKSRSKSMGPGGLDALKQGSGNRRASLAAPSKPPRSILKSSIGSLSEIPLPKPRKSNETRSSDGTTTSTRTSGSNTDDSGASKVALKTEEEQQAAAREREERERREARRKSLANRRVSFAAEATLHTFHEIEYMQDSTSSTNSSRRASSTAGVTGPESTPQDQIQKTAQSPDDQRHLHQQKRRSSAISQDDDTVTSIIYSDDSEPPDAVEEVAAEEDDGSSSDSDDGTLMSVEEVTGTSVGSERSSVPGDGSTLEEALRLAAQRASTQHVPSSPDRQSLDDGEEVIPSFGWIKKAQPQTSQATGSGAVQRAGLAAQDDHSTQMDMDMDMDLTQGAGRIVSSAGGEATNDDEDMSMDVTRVYGGIVPSEAAAKRGGNGDPGRSQPLDQQSDIDENEDMSMELTNVMGGVLSQQKRKSMAETRRRTMTSGDGASMDDDSTMDMTVGLGRIISTEDTDGDVTGGMDMTAAIGGIISSGAASPRTLNKKIMEAEADQPNSPKSAIMTAVRRSSPTKTFSAAPSRSPAADASSPGLSAFHGNSLRRSIGPQSNHQVSDVTAKTPSPPKPASPRCSSPLKSSSKSPKTTPRTASSKRPSPTREGTRTPSPLKPPQNKSSVFHNDPATGSRTPTVVLTPRRLSGVGADRSGLGSPRVADLFDRRDSIGDVAADFVPGKRAVSFQDPQQMASEVDQERAAEEEKENRRKILEREAEGFDENREGTANLRDMINSLSPKKNPMKSRKSLHVGSARGILGKRPAELDSDDDDAEERDGVKRLKGHQSSPVKNVRLKQPPSKAETTGHLRRSSRRSPEQSSSNATPTLSSPLKESGVTTPRHQTRFKDVEDDSTTTEVNFGSSLSRDAAELEAEADDGRIHLQDFLNMTSIRFMELTTTKRRHTIAPGTLQDGSLEDGQDDLSLERCVVAGACTVPNLELYQHSCRELKKYISEGRRIVREIESDTFEDNPALFREYMSATPDVKALMDHQFKNVKTHARFLSKAMWYEWRMKLQDGLKEGLVRIAKGMEEDDMLLKKQEDLLASVLPAVIERHDALTEECGNLEEVAQELASCDPAELQAARDELSALDDDISRKKKLIAELRDQFRVAEVDVESLSAQKEEYLADIRESEKIREDCRGWTSTEVNSLKGRVEKLEDEHGWAVTGLAGSTISMAYKRDIELVFDVASFQPHGPHSPIDLWYIGNNREFNGEPKTADKEFFLDAIRDHIRRLPQDRGQLSKMLDVVRQAWDKARHVSSQIKRANVTFPTTASRTSDSSVAVTSSVMLAPLRGRVETNFSIQYLDAWPSIDFGIGCDVKVVYGDQFNVGKMKSFLASKVGDKVDQSSVDLSAALVELHDKLLARGKK